MAYNKSSVNTRSRYGNLDASTGKLRSRARQTGDGKRTGFSYSVHTPSSAKEVKRASCYKKGAGRGY